MFTSPLASYPWYFWSTWKRRVEKSQTYLISGISGYHAFFLILFTNQINTWPILAPPHTSSLAPLPWYLILLINQINTRPILPPPKIQNINKDNVQWTLFTSSLAPSPWYFASTFPAPSSETWRPARDLPVRCQFDNGWKKLLHIFNIF